MIEVYIRCPPSNRSKTPQVQCPVRPGPESMDGEGDFVEAQEWRTTLWSAYFFQLLYFLNFPYCLIFTHIIEFRRYVDEIVQGWGMCASCKGQECRLEGCDVPC